ncbi:MAG TPA: type II secretion system protein GspM [Bryobacteraceae bacterium]|nr:type II secretion system protein GspM [Bryobacteraceae bacterium]
MNLSPRDRRALAGLAVAVILGLVYRFWPASTASTVVAPAADNVALAEKRLAKLRDTASTAPAKEAILKQVSSDLALRERGLINAATAAQAQAQLIQIVRRIGATENPPVEIRATEIGPVRPLGDAYGEALISVQVECRIDQLINMLAAIPSQPELVASSDLRVMSSNSKDKTVGVRLTLSGVVPRRLVPEKSKTGASL